jgi:tryptophan synthase alpha chain
MKSKRLLSLPERSIFSVFCTAGFPRLRDTRDVITRLAQSGVDMIELGFPFSDPVADGPTIQESNLRALRNGMTLTVLFDQLSELRKSVDVPVLLMGYLNPAEQFGFERFIREAARCGIDGLIIPDMPFEEYQERYKPLYREYGISPVFLVTSRTDEERIRSFDAEDPAFLYILSSDAVTGGVLKDSRERDTFFERLAGMGLKSKLIVGFGVSDAPTFKAVTKRTQGAIVGSAFIKAIATVEAQDGDAERSDFARSTVIENFVQSFQETR